MHIRQGQVEDKLLKMKMINIYYPFQNYINVSASSLGKLWGLELWKKLAVSLLLKFQILYRQGKLHVKDSCSG